ncbi:uncharacterized protein LOC134178650 [Corticium candelabrum]|uniref:uncharacterized protein LOC134178650 n=1 Tax=Corticium candelabrum TaxID=121492 RepID=UPI002E268271|nr:uncharacterized protein LOC134178650 [Corticium candelabrum]
MDHSELRSSCEFSDLTVRICSQQLHLHRFPLFSRSDYFRCLQRSGMSDTALVTLDHLPGGYDTMTLIADFCYGIPTEDKLTTKNIGHVTCAAIYLQMSGSGNLSELCQSRLKKLSSDAYNCLEILENCADVAEVAQSEGVSTFCVKTAVEHWCKLNIKAWNWFRHKQRLSSSWLSQLKNLPVNWTVAIIDLMQTREERCSHLTTYFVAGYIDFIMQCFADVRKTESCYAVNATPSSVDATLDLNPNPIANPEPVLLADSPSPVEIPSLLSCLSAAPSRLTSAASSASENGSEKQKTEGSALSSTATALDACLSRGHLLTDSEESLLKIYFDTFLSYIPDDALKLDIPTVTASWLSSVLQFSSAYVPQGEERLTALCANSYAQLTMNDVIDFTSRVMANLNESVHTKRYKDSNKVIELSDYYLNYHAERGTISAACFAEVLQSTLWKCRSSFDSPFEALEKLLQSNESKNESILQENVMTIIELIDFTKLSQDALERASQNSHIPSRVTMKAAVKVCSVLRNTLSESQANLSTTRDELSKCQRNLSTELSECQTNLSTTREDFSKCRTELSTVRTQLSKVEEMRVASERQMRLETVRHRKETVRLQGQLREAEAKVTKLELFPRLNGTWTIADTRERGYYSGGWHGQDTRDLSSSSLSITQISEQKEKKVISFTVKVKSHNSRCHPREQSESREVRVRPAYILPLINDRGSGRDANVSSQHLWETWYQSLKSSHSGGLIPPFLVYDLDDARIFSPWTNSYSSRRELFQWRKSLEDRDDSDLPKF